jgi:hypothetical protein
VQGALWALVDLLVLNESEALACAGWMWVPTTMPRCKPFGISSSGVLPAWC